jgi:hypothetical protein
MSITKSVSMAVISAARDSKFLGQGRLLEVTAWRIEILEKDDRPGETFIKITPITMKGTMHTCAFEIGLILPFFTEPEQLLAYLLTGFAAENGEG